MPLAVVFSSHAAAAGADVSVGSGQTVDFERNTWSKDSRAYADAGSAVFFRTNVGASVNAGMYHLFADFGRIQFSRTVVLRAMTCYFNETVQTAASATATITARKSGSASTDLVCSFSATSADYTAYTAVRDAACTSNCVITTSDYVDVTIATGTGWDTISGAASSDVQCVLEWEWGP